MFKRMAKIRRGAVLAALLFSPTVFAAPVAVTLYKSLQCSCCEAYVKYLREQGFQVEVKPVLDLHSIDQKAGVPDAQEGCHTSFIDGYVVVGHVPLDAIVKLLRERPKITGISISGMPAGLPGMPGARSQPVEIQIIGGAPGTPKVFMTVP